MDENAASVLFAPKPHSAERRFCIDYWWINQFLVSRQVLAPNVNGTIANCWFNVQTVNYLGMIIEAGQGVRGGPEKVKVILDWDFKDFWSKTAVRSFLGLCNYIRAFCHHASSVADPLTCLLKKDTPLDLGPRQEEAFESLK